MRYLRLALLVSSLAFATGLRLPTAASGQPNTWSRRAACCALPLAVLPLAATTATPLSASRVFSVREYVLDLKAARRGLDELTPLLERREPNTYEEARILLRKPPVNGVRKAASKILIVLEGEKEWLPAKTKAYENIKLAFAKLDDGCKVGVESAMTNTKTTPDLLPVLDELKAGINLFVSGLELPKPDPEPAAVETPTPAAEAA